MNQFDDPQPPAPPPASQQDAFDAEMMPTGPAPMSAMAVTGFVSSLIVCCPVLSPLLGLIFSLIGLSQTKGGVRRGRSLAYAGLIIAAIMVPIHGWGVPSLGRLLMSAMRLPMIAAALQSGDLEAGSQILYAMASPDLKAAKTEDELTAWISAEFNERGGLQSFVQDVPQAEPSPDGSLIRYRFKAEFPNETLVFYMDVRLDMWGHMYLENIVIGDSELLETKDSQPDSGAGDEPTDEKSAGDELTDDEDTDEDTDEDG